MYFMNKNDRPVNIIFGCERDLWFMMRIIYNLIHCNVILYTSRGKNHYGYIFLMMDMLK